CEISNLHLCLCPNPALQRELAICIRNSCNDTEVTVATMIFQGEVCSGSPRESRTKEIIRYTVIQAAITIAFVVMRMISRRLVTKFFCLDDLAVVISAIFILPLVAIVIFNASHGFGQHFWNIPPKDITLIRKLYYASQILYVLNLASSKFAILFLYRRIFVNARFRIFLNITIGWMVLYTLSFLMAVTFQCLPINSIWNKLVPGKCINSQALVYAGAALSIVEDLIIMVLPISELKSLKLDVRKRIGLCLLFALGSFACITSMIRLKYIIHFGNSIDSTWDNVDVVIWSNIETCTALICACLVCMRPLLMRILPCLFPASTRTKGQMTANRPRSSVLRSNRSDLTRSGKHNTIRTHCEGVLEEFGDQNAIMKTTSITITEDSMSFKMDDNVRHLSGKDEFL
ncbi:hypothetical protein BGZ60DRAFT_381646, partial [Tricladium varicosporioides]